jgi:hypothetical protein
MAHSKLNDPANTTSRKLAPGQFPQVDRQRAGRDVPAFTADLSSPTQAHPAMPGAQDSLSFHHATLADHPATAPHTTVNVNTGMPAVQFHATRQGHGFIVRALWFLAIGWWLSAFMIVTGYLLAATVILLPLGLWFLHRVPQAQTLRHRTREFTTEMRNGALVFTEGAVAQVAWYWRLLCSTCRSDVSSEPCG